MVEREREIAPDGSFDITDEWLNEGDTYQVYAELDEGQSTSKEVETHDSWACNHEIVIEITSDGQLNSSLSSGMRKGC